MSLSNSLISHLTKISRLQKLILIIGLLFGVFSYLSFASYDFSLYIGRILGYATYEPETGLTEWLPITVTSIPFITTLISIASLVFYYLQFGGRNVKGDVTIFLGIESSFGRKN